MTPAPSWSGPRGAFTLIELLVAIAILAMLGLFLAEVIASTGRGSASSNRSVDATAQARIAFDRLGIDLDNLVRRADVDAVLTNAPSATGKNLLLFYSSVTSPGLSSAANRNISLVSYRVQTHPDNNALPCLLRAAKPIPRDASAWGAQAFMGLKQNGLPVPLNVSDPAFASQIMPADGDYDILAQGVFRLVVGFQLCPDNRSVTLQDGTVLPHALGQLVYSAPTRTIQSADKSQTASYVDLDRIGSLVVGVASVDGETIRTLGAAHVLTGADLKSLADAFAVPGIGELPVAKWGAVADSLASSASASGSLPAPVRQNLRVFQRAFPVTRPNSQVAP